IRFRPSCGCPCQGLLTSQTQGRWPRFPLQSLCRCHNSRLHKGQAKSGQSGRRSSQNMCNLLIGYPTATSATSPITYSKQSSTLYSPNDTLILQRDVNASCAVGATISRLSAWTSSESC